MSNQFVGGVGVLTIEGREFKIAPIGLSDEVALTNVLAKVGSNVNKGQAYELLKPLLDVMTPQDRLVAVQQLAAQESDVNIQAYRGRGVPEGLACEVYYRSYRQMSELTLAECKAIINDVNFVDVSTRLAEIIRSGVPGKS